MSSRKRKAPAVKREGGDAAASSAIESAGFSSGGKRARNAAATTTSRDLTQTFMSYLESNGGKASDKDLKSKFGSRYAELVSVINSLLGSRRLVMEKTEHGNTYTTQSEEMAAKYDGLDQDHMLVLQEIRGSGNKGLWLRSIKKQTRISGARLNKALKLLLSKKLIKIIKSVLYTNKKIYMDYDTTPSEDHTGGPWYTEGAYDNSMIKALRKLIVSLCNKKGPQTIEELAAPIDKVIEGGMNFRESDLLVLVNSLILDGKLREIMDRGVKRYEVDKHDFWVSASNEDYNLLAANTEPPCIGCFPIGDCSVRPTSTSGQARKGAISPSTCPYMFNWLGYDAENLTF